MPRIVMFAPIKNEADRYLQAFLRWNQSLADDIFIWNDQSDDNSWEIIQAEHNRSITMIDREEGPSFLENEGKFREAGWNAMSDTFELKDGDWVVTLDCDEFWTGTTPSELAVQLDGRGFEAANIGISEIFKTDPPAERVDGWWAGIDGIRFARYRSGDQSFRRKTMACGTLPIYALEAKRPSDFYEYGARILHYGYADKADRDSKYERYSALSGHSSEHIESIQTPPVLSDWIGEQPQVWRGVR